MGRHSNQAELNDEPGLPAYARVLALKHTSPGQLTCFLYLEGSIGAALVLALTAWVSWWALVALPLTVAAMVKLNDVVAGKMEKARLAARRASWAAAKPRAQLTRAQERAGQ